MGRWRWGLVLIVVLARVPAHADAPLKERARSLYQEGLKKYNLGDFSTALEHFTAAYEALPDPAFLFNIAQCHRLLGHAPEALLAYRAYLREEPDVPNRGEVERLRTQMEDAAAKARSPDSSPPPPLEKPAPKVHLVEETAASPQSQVTHASSAQPHRAPLRTRWWFWTALGTGAAVVGIVVGVSVAATLPKDASVPPTSLGSVQVRF